MSSLFPMVSAWSFVVLALSLAPVSQAQQSPDVKRATGMALQVCSMLQEQAEKQQLDGQPPPKLVRAFAEKAGLNAVEAEALERVTARMRGSVAPLDAQAQAIIAAARAHFPGGRLPKGVRPPEPPSELAVLQRRRDEAVEAAIQELEKELGPAGHRKFQSYLHESFRKKIDRYPVRTPMQIGPPGRPTQPSTRNQEAVQ